MVHLKRILLTGFILFSGLAFGAFLANHLIPASIVYEEYPRAFIPSAPITGTVPTTTTPLQTSPDQPVSNSDLTDGMVMCTMDAKLCPDGSYVGRTGPKCEFAACNSDEPTSSLEIACSKDMKQADACIEIYAPVCASVQVECVTTPCNPVPQTFANSCFACMSDRVDSYIEGECLVPLTVS